MTLFHYSQAFAPNVKTITVRNAAFTFWECLLQEYENGNFQQLEEIPIPVDSEDIETYNQTAEALSGTLSHLFLGDQLKATWDGDIHNDAYLDLVEALNLFHRLTHLDIRRHTWLNLYENDFVLQKCCPSLKSITYTAFHSPLTDKRRFRYGRMEDRHRPVKLSRIEPLPNIEEFSARFILYTDDALKYIMHKFPRRKILKVNENLDVGGLADFIGTEELPILRPIMADFFRYLGNTPSFDYNNIYIRDSFDFMGEFLKEEDTSDLFGTKLIQIDYRFCYSTTDWSFSGYFDYTEEADGWDGESDINNAGLRIHNNPHNHFYEQYEQHKITTFSLFFSNLNNGVPHLRFMKDTGEVIRNLHIKNFDLKRKDPQDSDRIMYQISQETHLNSILIDCPQLQNLILESSSFTYHNPSVTLTNN